MTAISHRQPLGVRNNPGPDPRKRVHGPRSLLDAIMTRFKDDLLQLEPRSPVDGFQFVQIQLCFKRTLCLRGSRAAGPDLSDRVVNANAAISGSGLPGQARLLLRCCLLMAVRTESFRGLVSRYIEVRIGIRETGQGSVPPLVTIAMKAAGSLSVAQSRSSVKPSFAAAPRVRAPLSFVQASPRARLAR